MADAGDLKDAQNTEDSASSRNHSSASDEQSRVEPSPGQSVGNSDAVEVALATALTSATVAQEWELVAQLARELEARRKARSGTVDLQAEREKRGQR